MKIFTFLIVIGFSLNVTAQQSAPSPLSDGHSQLPVNNCTPFKTYGSAFHHDYLANTTIGEYENKASYRIKAKKSGEVDELLFYIINATCEDCKKGYFNGHGGHLKIELTTDYRGFPTDKVLASYLMENPNAVPMRPVIKFDPPARLEKDKVYHIKFSNPHVEHLTDFVSINSSLVAVYQGDCIQPGIPSYDLATTISSHNEKWSIRKDNVPGMRGLFTPIYQLHFTDGDSQGQSYQYGADLADRDGIDRPEAVDIDYSEAKKVRQVIKVTSGDKVVEEVFVRLKKVGAPSTLSMQLIEKRWFRRDRVIKAIAIQPSQISAKYSWVGGGLPVTLKKGKSYYLLLEENAGSNKGHYRTFSIYDGTYHNFTTGFTDGHSEYMGGSGPWKNLPENDSKEFDLQFYFKLK